MKRIGIVGSRSFPNRDKVIQLVNSLPIDFEVVTGGAPGVDTWAELMARERGLDLNIYYPDWTNLGKSAGIARNTLIVQNSDCIVAFWHNSSKGTKDSIKKAVAARKPVFVVTAEDDVPTLEEILSKFPASLAV